MCTVTYLPLGNNDFMFTSNRDETPFRKTIFPKKHVENGVEMIYPKDEKAGGTWIGLSKKNRLVCLLNGGLENHTKKNTYRMSRGVLVKKILSVENPVQFITDVTFDDVEPFTIILLDWNTCLIAYELIWTGTEKHFTELDDSPKIWSSSTLYTSEMKELRKKWFADWIAKNPEFQQQNIIDFHTNDSKGTPHVSVKMKRSNVETVSVTSVQKSSEKIQITYLDFVNDDTIVIADAFS